MYNRVQNDGHRSARRYQNAAPTAALKVFNARAPRSDSIVRRRLFQALADFPEDEVGSTILLRGRSRFLALTVVSSLILKAWRRAKNNLFFKTEECNVFRQLLQEKAQELEDLIRSKEFLLRHLRETLRISAHLRDEVAVLRDQWAQLQSDYNNSSDELDCFVDVNIELMIDNMYFYYELLEHSLEAERLRNRSVLSYIMQIFRHYLFRVVDHFIT